MSNKPNVPQPADEEDGCVWETVFQAVALSVALGVGHVLLMALGK